MKIISKWLVLITIFTSLVATIVYAQDEEETPLPSKTPTPTNEPRAPQPTTEAVQLDFDIEEPFIQSDLSILSGNVQRPNGMFWHNGNVYTACNGDWTIYEINAETGSTITYLWGIRNAHTLYAEDDENGFLNLWVPDFQQNAFVRVYQGSIQTIAPELEGPWGISPHGDKFIVTNLLGNSLVEIERLGNVKTLATGFRSPAGVVVHEDTVYIANNGSARRAIEWLAIEDLGNGVIDTTEENAIQSLVSGVQNPTGMTMGADGNLYFTYSLGTRGVVGRVDPQICREKGGCTNNEVEIVVYTDLAAPLAGLSISPDMKLYTHTIFSPDIYYIDLAESSGTTVSRLP